MAVEKERTAEPVKQDRQLGLDRSVVWPMGLGEPLIELLGADCTTPQIPMLRSAGWNDPEAAACSGADASPPSAVNDRRIDFVFAPIAVDRSAWCAGDHSTATPLERAPYQAIDERIF
jgi:hypothetical protein